MSTVRLTGHTSSDLGDRLRCLRKQRGLKQRDVTEKLGLKKTTLSFIETGKRMPKRETLERLAAFYEIPVDDLAVLAHSQPLTSLGCALQGEQEGGGVIDADGETALVAAVLQRLRKDLRSKDSILRYGVQEWLDGSRGSIGFYADILGIEPHELRARMVKG